MDNWRVERLSDSHRGLKRWMIACEAWHMRMVIHRKDHVALYLAPGCCTEGLVHDSPIVGAIICRACRSPLPYTSGMDTWALAGEFAVVEAWARVHFDPLGAALMAVSLKQLVEEIVAREADEAADAGAKP